MVKLFKSYAQFNELSLYNRGIIQTYLVLAPVILTQYASPSQHNNRNHYNHANKYKLVDAILFLLDYGVAKETRGNELSLVHV